MEKGVFNITIGLSMLSVSAVNFSEELLDRSTSAVDGNPLKSMGNELHSGIFEQQAKLEVPDRINSSLVKLISRIRLTMPNL